MAAEGEEEEEEQEEEEGRAAVQRQRHVGFCVNGQLANNRSRYIDETVRLCEKKLDAGKVGAVMQCLTWVYPAFRVRLYAWFAVACVRTCGCACACVRMVALLLASVRAGSSERRARARHFAAEWCSND